MASFTVRALHSQPCSRAHCNMSREPAFAEPLHVEASHGHPFARSHFNTSKCPPSADKAQDLALQGHFPSFVFVSAPGCVFAVRSHFKTSRRPCPAALDVAPAQIGQLFSHAHCKTSRFPLPAARLVKCSSHSSPRDSFAHRSLSTE
eukprot:31080-Pelagococcus_subviridis.AAC.2